MPTGGQLTADQRFTLERFGRLLARRLQVAVALQQVSLSEIRRSWLIRALDSAIADHFGQLQRMQLAELAREQLAGFRETQREILAQDPGVDPLTLPPTAPAAPGGLDARPRSTGI